jgi:type 1 fimbria pilin
MTNLDLRARAGFPGSPAEAKKSAKALAVATLFAGLRLLVLLAGCLAAPAQAVSLCEAKSGLPDTIDYPATVAVPNSLGSGETIPGTARSFSISGSCVLGKGSPAKIQVGSTIVACTVNPTTEVMPGVYATGVSGIGMRLRDGGGSPVTNGSGQACASVVATIGSDGTYAFSGSFELVRIGGAVPSGSTALVPANATWAFGVYNTNVVLNADKGNIYSGSSSLYPAGNTQLRGVTCDSVYPVVVTLPDVSTTELASTGAAGSTGFSIGLRCDDSVQVGITLDAASSVTVADVQKGILDVMPGGATGVGLQILRGTGGIHALEHRIGLGSVSANTLADFPFTVRYVRLPGQLTPGSVTSAMVFTFDYQ